MVKRGGSVNPAKFPDEVFDLLSIPAFDQGKVEVLAGSEIGSSKSCVQENDVLLSKIIPHIRRCWVVPKGGSRRQIGSGEWIIFRSEKLDSKYLKHYLTSNGFHRQFMNTVAGVGGSLVRARPAAVEKIKIPHPPLNEQKRIAAILDKADAIRRKRQQAIVLTDQLLRSVFLDMFGDPVNKGWELTSVEKVAIQEKGSMRTGPFGSQLLHSEFTDDGIAVLGIDNAVQNIFQWAKPRFISEKKYEQLKRFTVKPADILITIMGTCGRSAIVPDDCPVAINTKHLCCITLNHNVCIPEFLHSYFLMHPVSRVYLQKTAKGSSFEAKFVSESYLIVSCLKNNRVLRHTFHRHS